MGVRSSVAYSLSHPRRTSHAPSWSSNATPSGTRSVSRSLSDSARMSLRAPSPLAIASFRTPSRKDESVRRYGMSTSSRYPGKEEREQSSSAVSRTSWDICFPSDLAGRERKWELVNATHVDAPLLGTPLLAPPELGRLALPQPEHTELLANPAGDALHKPNLEVAAGCLQIHVRARDEIPQDSDRLRGVERVAERRPEGPLTCMETAAENRNKN